MNRPRLSSPIVLLIVAATAAAGTYLLDLFILEPHVTRQKNLALRGLSAKAQTTVEWALRTEQNRLSALCGLISQRSDPAVSPGGQSLARTIGEIDDVDAAWLCSPDGRVVRQWRPGGPGDPDLTIALAPGDRLPAADGDAETGLLDLGGETVAFARRDLYAGGDNSAPVGQLYLARRLGGSLLRQIGSAVQANVSLVGADGLPGSVRMTDCPQRAYWALSPNRLAVAFPAKDTTGKTLGYFLADFAVAEIYKQTSTLRRTTLTILSLSAGVVILVVLGSSILLANPITRLLNRVRKVNAEEYLTDEFTRDLHAEPLALAKRLQQAFKASSELSKIDPLTGLANRRQFDEALQRAYAEAQRYHHVLSVVVADVDLFKAINDTCGHQSGDELLKSVADIIRECCRETDVPARFGGDEFIVLLPETSADSAAVVAERIRSSVSDRTFIVNGSELNMTVSIGIADLDAGDIEQPDSLVVMADRALYSAKQLGRNRVVRACDLDKSIWERNSRENERVERLREKLIGLDGQFKDLYVRALKEIVRMLERRDPHMADHARKVLHYAALIGRKMNLPEQFVKRVELSAILHDIGMLALPDSVALCQGRLDKRQLESMQRHPLIGGRILEGMEFLELVISPVRSHHERFDGKGYPDGLSGQAIPLAARIIAVADVFDAMTSLRAFRGAKSVAESLAELKRASGTQLDPDVVAALIAEAERLGEKLTDIPLPQSSDSRRTEAPPPATPTTQDPAEAICP